MLGSSIKIATSPGVFSDDVPIKLGSGGTVKIQYETADANANYLAVIFPEGGSVDVPAFVIGDASIDNVDTAVLNGLTEPSYVVFNDAADAYVRIDAGDDGVAGSKGIYFKAAADEDIELLNLSVTGTPRIFWDESEDAISLPNITLAGNKLKTTNHVFKSEDAGSMAIRNNADDAYRHLALANLYAGGSIIARSNVDSAVTTDEVHIDGYDLSAGNRAISISQEAAVAADADETKFSNKLPCRINGATYYIMLTAT